MERAVLSFLVLNAGSSSLKYGVFDASVENELESGTIEVKSLADYGAAVSHIEKKFSATAFQGIGHRVVHGGEQFREPVRINSAVKKELQKLDTLAPLHNPSALAALAAAEKAFPNASHVAVFDTSFYAELPDSRIVYPLPYAWYKTWRIRRYGFHGISHAYAAAHVSALMKRPITQLNLISCHLGNGCSATAVRRGKAEATTMGFTPMEGLMMGTRSGSVDPGVLLYLEQARGLSAGRVDQDLNHASGLLGVSGISGDFRNVQAAAHRKNKRAQLALTMYADRVREAIGSLAVTLGHVDALVFTGGVGEHSAELRREVCRGLEILGIRLEHRRNAANKPETDIAAHTSRSRVWVVHAREELMIAREVRNVLTT